jgi:hypothetical protein
MKMFSAKSGLLALSLVLSGAQGALAGDGSPLGKEWSKSGFGSNVTYKCKQPSCGGPNSQMMVARFGGISGSPELGIPGGSNVEAEFRRRPEVRRTLAALLQHLTREGPTKGSSIKSAYFTDANYVGFNFTLSNAQQKVYMVGQLRINDNKAFMIGGGADTAAVARRNFNLILPTVKVD